MAEAAPVPGAARFSPCAHRCAAACRSIQSRLIPPITFYEAIQRLRIVVILFEVDGMLVVLVLAISRASSGLVVITEFIVVIVGAV
jgi:hypothetical protein